MSIEQVVYDRLSSDVTLSGSVLAIYPTEPEENAAALPYLVYTINPAEVTLFNSGTSDLHRYTVTIDAYAITIKECLAVLSLVKARLNGWRGGNVQFCKFDTQATMELDPGSQAQHSYTLWVNEANVTALADSTGQITTGNNSVTLTACENVLTLDCDGLKLNGGPVGTEPDLSGYATLAGDNQFTGNNQFAYPGSTTFSGETQLQGNTTINGMEVTNTANFTTTATFTDIDVADYIDIPSGQIVANDIITNTFQVNTINQGVTIDVSNSGSIAFLTDYDEGAIAPDNPTPVGWLRVEVNGGFYKLPLYQ